MGSARVSGQSLEGVGIFHQRDRECRSPVGEDIFLIIARNLKGEAMPVHIDVDDLVVGMDDLDRRAGEHSLGVIEKVVVVGEGHDGRPRWVDHHPIKIMPILSSGKIPEN